MVEVWKSVKGYEGLYEVSNMGRVRSNRRILSSNASGYRYAQVALMKDGQRKVCSVHRLVAESFIPNPNGYEYVNHIDFDKNNNCVTNLEWCTKEFNNQNRSNCLKFKR